MFQNKKIKSLINIKTFLVFGTTLILGLLVNSVCGRYIFKFSVTETFTVSEAKAKIGRRVTAKCFDELGFLEGTIISYQRIQDRRILIKVKWDKPIMGKFETIDFEKETYQICFEK